MTTPPPLPPRSPSAPAAPEPLSYATPAPRGSFLVGAMARFHFGIFFWSLALVVVWMLILELVLPHFENVFRDFHVELPASTRALLVVRTIVLYGGFAVLLAIP